MVTWDAETFRSRFIQNKAQKRDIEARHRAAAEAECEALDVALDRMVLDALLGGGVTVSEIAASIPTSRSSIYHLKNRALAREGMTEAEYLEYRYNAKLEDQRAEAKREASKFAIRREFRGRLHVAVNDALGDGIVNVYLDPVEMRVLNVSEYENGIREEMAGPRVEAWQAELDSDGSALRLTVDDWKAGGN